MTAGALIYCLLLFLPVTAGADQDPSSARDSELEKIRSLYTIAAAHRGGAADEDGWERLITAATAAVDDSLPPLLNEAGTAFSGEIEEWAREREISAREATYYARIGRGMRLKALAFARDQRALPLFLRALKSNDTLISAAAVIGLVELEQVDALDEIEKETSRDPELSKIIGTYLLTLDHPEAQRIAARLINDDITTYKLRRRIEKLGRKQILFGGDMQMFDLE